LYSEHALSGRYGQSGALALSLPALETTYQEQVATNARLWSSQYALAPKEAGVSEKAGGRSVSPYVDFALLNLAHMKAHDGRGCADKAGKHIKLGSGASAKSSLVGKAFS